MILRKLLLVLALTLPTAARAEWKEASSRHFIVLSEGGEERLVKVISDLEKYDFMLRFVTKAKPPTIVPPKIKIYLMRDMSAVAVTMGGSGGSGVAGYYTASARGPIAVGLRGSTGGGDYALESQEVLFHELAHHFMFQYFPAAYPSWYSEGFADYYGTAKILDKDVIEVGHGLKSRYAAFLGNGWLPLDKLLTAKSYADVGGNIDLLYSEGWLLVHYLSNNKERKGQLEKYLGAINAGQSYKTAMDNAFGEGAKALNAELRAYSRKGRISALSLPFKPIDTGAITRRTLSPAEDAMVGYDIAIGRGILKREAAKFAGAVAATGRRFPDDPHALRLQVEAWRLAGDRAAAAAALDRWIKLRPNDGLALMHRAELAIDALKAAGSADQAAWETARQDILAANKKTPRNPQILNAFYASYTAQGVLPPPGAQNALVRAFELVPQDDYLRHMVAADFEARGMIAEAIGIIKPAAVQLHSAETDPKKKERDDAEREKYRGAGDNRSETAQEMLTRLEKKLAEKSGQTASQ